MSFTPNNIERKALLPILQDFIQIVTLATEEVIASSVSFLNEMLMPKKERMAIYEHLFKEGVMVAKKDFHAPKHPELETIQNLHVIKAMQSLKSRGFVKEQFAWRHYYWYLTNEGIRYLRDFLHLPPEIVPSTLKRQQRTESVRPKSMPSGRPEGGRSAEDRAGYRRFPDRQGGGADKKDDVGPGSANFEFRGGYGRGRM